MNKGLMSTRKGRSWAGHSELLCTPALSQTPALSAALWGQTLWGELVQLGWPREAAVDPPEELPVPPVPGLPVPPVSGLPVPPVPALPVPPVPLGTEQSRARLQLLSAGFTNSTFLPSRVTQQGGQLGSHSTLWAAWGREE